MNGHPEIAGADPLLHDLFKLDRRLLLLIHAGEVPSVFALKFVADSGTHTLSMCL